jgi:hypothetical protein
MVIFPYRNATSKPDLASIMLRMGLFSGLFLAELFRCVSEHGVIANDAWHVSIVGVKLSGCMYAPP